MASFVVIGVAVSVVLHYEFLSVTQNRFPGGQELVEFLGFFLGIGVLLAWILKRFLFHWIKSKFGIRITLLLLPVALLLLTILRDPDVCLLLPFGGLIEFIQSLHERVHGTPFHEPDLPVSEYQGTREYSIGY